MPIRPSDPVNEKKKALKQGDRLFGTVIATKVSIVEFVYPEDGTFGFNFVAIEEPGKSRPPLRTKEILIGSQRDLAVPDAKDKYNSVIHVYGPAASESDSRGAAANEPRIERLDPKRTTYEGVVLLSPTEDQVYEAVHYGKPGSVEEQK